MKFAHHLAHLVFPRESNNQKAKLLHSSTITLISLALIAYQLLINLVGVTSPSILGYAANISPEEVVRLTNEKRVQAGLNPLDINSVLSQAAQAKGADMLNKGYWAHVAPDGTEPWQFFKNAGFKYRFAGENLARDFSNPDSAVEAWMSSPSHRENLLSPKYREIGVAVVEGKLAGVDTTIIVQFFGTSYTDTIPTVPVAQVQPAASPVSEPQTTPVAVAVNLQAQQPLKEIPTPLAYISVPAESELPQTLPTQQILVSPFQTTKGVSLAVIGILLSVLVVDAVVVSKRRIARIGGRTFAHLAFLGIITAVILILRAGQVL